MRSNSNTLKRVIERIVLLLVVACIDPSQIDIPESDNILVVEGIITTDEGPYTVSLSRTAKFGSVFDGVIGRVTGALVLVRDNEGQVAEFTETLEGIYQSPTDFRGEVGKTYTLQIETSLGARYSSLPQTIIEGPEIDSVIVRYRRDPSADPVNFVSGVEVFSQFQDPGDQRNFFLWEIEGTHIIRTFPERFSVPGPPRMPAPKDCCDRCWINENLLNQSNVFSDEQLNGQTITAPVGFLVDDGLRFTEKYYANVRQYSMNEEAFNFYTLIQSQVEIDGDLFDPPPARIRGNIINLDDPTEDIIGFFSAFGIQERAVFIDRDILEDSQRAVEILDDCRTLPTATIDPPDFWEF